MIGYDIPYTIHTADGEAIHGEIVPLLFGNHATDAFEAAIAEHENAPKTEDGKKRRRSEARAAANGQLVSAGFYQYLASDKSFQHSLTPQKNKNAYIALMTPEFFDKLDFSDGVLSFDNGTTGVSSCESRYSSIVCCSVSFAIIIRPLMLR